MTKFRAILLASALVLSHGAAMAAEPLVTNIFSAPAADVLTTKLANLPAGQIMRVVLSLPLRDQAGAEAFAQAVSDPTSPDYGKYLTPKAWGARFGASQADYDAAVGWAQAHGLKLGERMDSRTTLSVSGPVGTLQALFATQLASFKTVSGEIGFGPTVAPALPSELSGHVEHVVGLSSARRFATLARKAPANVARPQSAGGSGVSGAYAPVDFRNAYDVQPQYGAPRTETIAIFEQGGFIPSDIAVFKQQYKLPNTPVVVRNVNGYNGTVNNADVELESVLDIDTAIGINPLLKNVMVYEDGNDSFNVALLDSLAAIAQDNIAHTVSISYGAPEAVQGAPAMRAERKVLLQLVAQGQGVYVSAGDNGAYEYTVGNTLAVLDPASQPLVTSVGGTTLLTAPNGSYGSEYVWNELSDGFGGTGGGVSNMWAIPSYQLIEGASVAVANRGSATFRNVPDIAADADPLTGASVYSGLAGGWIQVGGTSLAAPIQAGIASLVDAARIGTGLSGEGFLNPKLYAANKETYFKHDVTIGNNSDFVDHVSAGFNAGPAFDNVTGYGSMDSSNLIFESLIPITYARNPDPATDLAAKAGPTKVTISWKPGKRAVGYYVEVGEAPSFTKLFYNVTTTDSATITGLTPSTNYEVVVYSISAANSSDASEVISFDTTK